MIGICVFQTTRDAACAQKCLSCSKKDRLSSEGLTHTNSAPSSVDHNNKGQFFPLSLPNAVLIRSTSF